MAYFWQDSWSPKENTTRSRRTSSRCKAMASRETLASLSQMVRRPITRSLGNLHEIPIRALGLDVETRVRVPRDPSLPKAPPRTRRSNRRGKGMNKQRSLGQTLTHILVTEEVFIQRLQDAFHMLLAGGGPVYNPGQIAVAIMKTFGKIKPKRFESIFRLLDFIAMWSRKSPIPKNQLRNMHKYGPKDGNQFTLLHHFHRKAKPTYDLVFH
ncbi:hypothetical protein Q1695_011353 [Nippostrongylus brasiliensis]|nr:hypothetical protein Q1695_011353 [Nippostrongylus brasiliensis]